MLLCSRFFSIKYFLFSITGGGIVILFTKSKKPDI